MMTPKWFSRILTIVILCPYGWNVYRALTSSLGAEPIQELMEQTGLWGWRLLLLNLIFGSCLALFKLTPKFRSTLTLFRRPLGIVSFSYLFLHLGFFILNETGVLLAFSEIRDRLYLTVAFGAWLILMVLTLTSNNIAVRKLGRNWKPVHRLVYLATALAIVHVLLNEKSDSLRHGIETLPILGLWFVRLGKWTAKKVNSK